MLAGGGSVVERPRLRVPAGPGAAGRLWSRRPPPPRQGRPPRAPLAPWWRLGMGLLLGGSALAGALIIVCAGIAQAFGTHLRQRQAAPTILQAVELVEHCAGMPMGQGAARRGWEGCGCGCSWQGAIPPCLWLHKLCAAANPPQRACANSCTHLDACSLQKGLAG